VALCERVHCILHERRRSAFLSSPASDRSSRGVELRRESLHGAELVHELTPPILVRVRAPCVTTFGLWLAWLRGHGRGRHTSTVCARRARRLTRGHVAWNVVRFRVPVFRISLAARARAQVR
jgi:hypothetical protein